MKKISWEITSLKNRPELNKKAASWFHEKWNIPEEAYMESIIESQRNPYDIPKWYIIMDNEERIIAGAGIIENDFHKRKDLKPNVCALYVEEDYRNMGIAKALLDCACEDAYKLGYETLYLITEHINFYEKCGWKFYGMIEEENGHLTRMYENDIKNYIK